MIDALARIEPVARGLLREVDDVLVAHAAPAEHPVWALLRRLATTPADAVRFFAGLDPATDARDAVVYWSGGSAVNSVPDFSYAVLRSRDPAAARAEIETLIARVTAEFGRPGFVPDLTVTEFASFAAEHDVTGAPAGDLVLFSRGKIAHSSIPDAGRNAVVEVALVGARTSGPVVLVGSSMGGWLMLLAGRALGARLAALVGIAAAPDFTDWGFTADERSRLAAGETVYEDNPYGPEPTPIHPGFWADGEAQRLLGGEVALDCPVRLLHGQDDDVVPPEISLRLARALRSRDVQVTLVKGGDHRLSRAQDIALLLHTVAALT